MNMNSAFAAQEIVKAARELSINTLFCDARVMFMVSMNYGRCYAARHDDEIAFALGEPLVAAAEQSFIFF